jgi:uncharacterized alkaline shock family protein YloU
MNGASPRRAVPSLDLGQRQAPCGADIDGLLEQVAAGRAGEHDEHQTECPHCQAALIELADVWAPVRRLADQPVVAPSGILTVVMRHIDRLTEDIWYTLHRAEAGAITVATRVVATIARQAALRVPGVRVAFGRSSAAAAARAAEAGTRQHRHPHAAAGVMGRTAVVDLALTVTHGQSIEHVARTVQRRVAADLRDTLGLQHVAVNITVDDVLPPPATEPAGGGVVR